jgi:hypothetical protein
MMRQSILVPLFATAALLAPQSAHAASSSATTVVGRAGVPSPLETNNLSCGANHGTYQNVIGPGTPPLGTGSLTIGTPKDTGAGVDASVSAPLPSGLSAASISTSVPTADAGDAYASIDVSFPNNITDQLVAELPATGAWTRTNLLSATLSWYDENGEPLNGTAGTLAAFAAAHPGGTVVDIELEIDACSSATPLSISVDDFTVGVAGANTTVDFEPTTPQPGVITTRLDHTAIAARKPVTLGATVTSAGLPVNGQSMQLWAAPAGKTSFRQVAVATTNASGVATSPAQRPTATTSYEWRAPAGSDIATQTTPARRVSVASAVTLVVHDTSVAKGKPFAVSGVVTPGVAGDEVTLWREKGKRAIRISATTTSHYGSYAFKGHLPRGHYKLFVTAAKDATNTASTSPHRKFTVR